MVKESQLILSDRSLMPGDVVRRLVKDKDTQRGYCRNVEVFATVQIVGTKQVWYKDIPRFAKPHISSLLPR